jgi:FkbM family methyltransferase
MFKQLVGNSIGRAAQAVGYEFVKRNASSLGDRDATQELAGHLHKLFALLNIQLVLDVGANKGQYHDFLRKYVGFKGRIVSFEPIPELVRELQSAAKSDPLWTVTECAVGSFDGTAKFNVADQTGWSSLLERASIANTDVAARLTTQRTVDVQVRRLDNLLPELLQGLSIKHLYLKLDTQGNDLEAMRGAGEYLHQIPALQSELEFIRVYQSSPSVVQSLQFLEEQQFGLTGCYALWRDESLRVGEMDAVFRNLRHT